MFREQSNTPAVQGAKAVLHLNGTAVGTIVVQGWDASWTYGHFRPAEGFGRFAPVYGRWSLLMHADEREPLSRAASEELRETEQQMDKVRARVFFPERDVWHDCVQLNIDGELIEWKEF